MAISVKESGDFILEKLEEKDEWFIRPTLDGPPLVASWFANCNVIDLERAIAAGKRAKQSRTSMFTGFTLITETEKKWRILGASGKLVCDESNFHDLEKALAAGRELKAPDYPSPEHIIVLDLMNAMKRKVN